MKKLTALVLALLLSLSLFVGCGSDADDTGPAGESNSSTSDVQIPSENDEGNNTSSASEEPNASTNQPEESDAQTQPPAEKPDSSSTSDGDEGQAQADKPVIPGEATAFSLSSVPDYTGDAYVAINGNAPYFDTSILTPVSVEDYSPLDNLGRCGVAYACIGKDIMPTEERGSIGQVKPSGWHTVRYDDLVDGKYLYNRCHLIGYQLSGENANTSNLITGTRYLNIEGMLPFENMTADYVKETGNHVAYRVTPIFEGNNLVARGVLMEGYSIEDSGQGICFCVYAYNVQPGISIDYTTGDSEVASGAGGTTTTTTPTESQTTTPPADPAPSGTDNTTTPQTATYILNTNTKKFHLPGCSSVKSMKESNKREFTGTRDEVINQGYEPCKRCNP